MFYAFILIKIIFTYIYYTSTNNFFQIYIDPKLGTLYMLLMQFDILVMIWGLYILLFFFLKNLLKYSWFIMCSFLLCSKVIQLHIYIHSFILGSVMVYHSIWNKVPWTIRQRLCCLSIVYILVCTCLSQTPPLSLPHTFSPSATTSLFFMSVSLFHR